MTILKINHDQSCEHFERNASGDIVIQKTFSCLSDCPAVPSDNNLTIIVPGEDVALYSVKLPCMRVSELRRAIPFALEEQLACDPENIDIAIGTQKKDGVVVVAVTEKNWLEKKMIVWNEAGFYPAVVIPDYLAVSDEPDSWVAVGEKNKALIRMNGDNGLTIDIDHFPIWLDLFLKKNPEKKPKKIFYHRRSNDDNVDGGVRRICEALSIPIEISDFNSRLFLQMNNPLINLLQGKYKPKAQLSQIKKLWWRCGAVFSCWIAFLFFSNITQSMYLHIEIAKINEKILASYQTLFPQSDTILEPYFRTNALLKKYRDTVESGVFLKLFGIAGKTVVQFPSITVNAIQFHHAVLIFTIAAQNQTELNEWITLLRKNNLQVTNKNFNIMMRESQ